VHRLTALSTAEVEPVRWRYRLRWLCVLPLLGRHVTRTTPWAALISGCLAGTVVLAVVAHFAVRGHWQLGQAAVRDAFLPVVAALAFVPRASFRPVTRVTPVPSWVTPAGQILLAVPVLAATCWAQLRISARTVPAHGPAGPAALYPLIAQLTAWCLVTIAAAACIDRSRYADLGGAVAAPVSLVAIGLVWYWPVTSRFLVEPPATAHGVTIAWCGIGIGAAVLAGAAMRDGWHRYARRRDRRKRTPGGLPPAQDGC
jgi:hypothetical protein